MGCMGDTAIRAVDVSKRYYIGGRQDKYKTLRDTLTKSFTAPFHRAAQLLRGQVSGVSGLYEELWALKDVSFEIKHGEVVGIIGRNGAGKSTLLKILSRITEPTTGYIDVYGRVGSLLEVGTGFHPELTGRENIYLNGAILGMKKNEIDRKFDEIVAFAEVDKFIDTPVKHYSSGMGLRLGFAVAAHLETEILVVDEVLAVGDAAFQKKCLGKMSDVASQGRTVLFVSHNMGAMRTLCSSAIFLEQGRLVVKGSSGSVISEYLHGTRQREAEHIWKNMDLAPGNASLRLKRVAIHNHLNENTVDIDISEPFHIEIEYTVLKQGIRTGATIVLKTEDGTIVFSSISNRDHCWHGRARPEGTYRSTCSIPSHLLNEGRYYISIILWQEDYRLSVQEDDILQIQLHDSGHTRNGYFGGWSGLVRPMLDWTTEHLA